MAEEVPKGHAKVQSDSNQYSVKTTISKPAASDCSCCQPSTSSSASGSRTSGSSSPSASSASSASSSTSVTSASGHSCCCRRTSGSADQSSVFILKASKRRLYNVEKSSLKLLDPVAEIPNNQVGLEIMHNLTRLKKHGRSVCRSKNFLTGEMLMDFHKNDSAHVGKPKHHSSKSTSCCSSRKSSASAEEPQLYNLFLADLCTLPGTCTCDPTDCHCDDCVVHNGPLKDSKLDLQQQLDQCSLAPQQPVPSCCGQWQQQPNPPQLPLSQSQSDDAAKLFYPQDSTDGVVSFGQVGVQPVLSNNVFNSSPANSSTDVSTPECLCQPDECACYNCDAHGIVNGVRISDGVRVSSLEELPIDMQLAYMSKMVAPVIEPTTPPIKEGPYEGALKTLLPETAPTSQLPQQHQQQHSVNEILLDFSDLDDSCNCPEGQCSCVNCFKHGRFGNADII
ncbi:DEKNAAC102428 [Brettanomyces naardenensis]|uniref:DEKNAAC102428 n=1 Tax=Brettanomyces naardenensis TaxID=13370 RepID=A0A448YKI6_BRENA|nr:DEKNAAC102428 [Brettanomyces naardenensis]